MIHHHQPRHVHKVEFHLMGCDCARCNPPAPRAARLRAPSRSVQVLLGFAVGQALVILLDSIVGGPGPLVVFGL